MMRPSSNQLSKNHRSNAITNLLGRSNAVTGMLAGAAVDAGLVYALHPDRRRRPMIGRGKLLRIYRLPNKATYALAADVSSRAKRWFSQIKSLMHNA
jgi:hypothetical protein